MQMGVIRQSSHCRGRNHSIVQAIETEAAGSTSGRHGPSPVTTTASAFTADAAKAALLSAELGSETL